MDTSEQHYEIPTEPSYRPDILNKSSKFKNHFIKESNTSRAKRSLGILIPTYYNFKMKYFDFSEENTSNGYQARLNAVEVGSKIIPEKYIYHLLKNLSLIGSAVSSFKTLNT